jgi:hypothetical protein
MEAYVHFKDNKSLDSYKLFTDELQQMNFFVKPNVNLKNIDKWECVQDGKLTPKPFAPTEMSNKRTFKIPLMLRTIGGLIGKINFIF